MVTSVGGTGPLAAAKNGTSGMSGTSGTQLWGKLLRLKTKLALTDYNKLLLYSWEGESGRCKRNLWG